TLFVRSVVWQGCDPLAKDGDQKVLPPWPELFEATVAAFAKRKAGRGAITFLGGRLAWPWSLAPVRVELVVQAPFEGVVVQAHASGARIRRMGLGYVELQFRSSALAGSSSEVVLLRRRISGINRRTRATGAHSPSRPDTLAPEGSSTAGAFLRALAVAFHRSPTSLRGGWRGTEETACVVASP